MYYFDSEFLAQYLEQNTPIRVYVDSELFDVVDSSDVEDPTFGIGYNVNGAPHTFDYREIEQIQVAGNVLTLDQLQDMISPESDDSESGAADDPGGEEADEPPTDSEPDTPDEEEADEPPRESLYYQALGHKILSEAMKKIPVTPEGITVGCIVENIDMRCEYLGSRGAVTDVILPGKGGGMTMIEYRIHNYGYNFKPGEKVTKPLSSLKRIGDD